MFDVDGNLEIEEIVCCGREEKKQEQLRVRSQLQDRQVTLRKVSIESKIINDSTDFYEYFILNPCLELENYVRRPTAFLASISL